jgi:hypothetical protein
MFLYVLIDQLIVQYNIYSLFPFCIYLIYSLISLSVSSNLVQFYSCDTIRANSCSPFFEKRFSTFFTF